ncbi:MAG: EthD domain-containing protein [Dehalococcoidales bacterium]|nr:EthD domain-containing protein [Dehalococcoidales bacterium]
MIKSIVVAKRKAGMTREEFQKYWKDTHGPLAAKYMPGVRKYVQNHVIEVPGMEFNADGIVEMWYDDIETYLNTMKYLQSDEGKFLAEDGDKFAEIDGSNVWIVEEHVIK